MASLQARQESNRAILQAINNSKENLPPRNRRTYAAVTSGQDTTSANEEPQPPHPIPHQAPNTKLETLTNQQPNKDKTINEAQNSRGQHDNLHAPLNENPWILVTRRKPQGLKLKSNPQTKRSKHIETLMQQKRCFKCLDRGHRQYE